MMAGALAVNVTIDDLVAHLATSIQSIERLRLGPGDVLVVTLRGPMCKTLDHIIPLSHGGLHERRNVRLAHFICNSRRGDHDPAQTRLFG